MSPFIVEVEVLTLSFAFCPNHFGDRCPIPAMFHQAYSNTQDPIFARINYSATQTPIKWTAMPTAR